MWNQHVLHLLNCKYWHIVCRTISHSHLSMCWYFCPLSFKIAFIFSKISWQTIVLMSQYSVILISLLIYVMYYESGCIIPVKNWENFLGEVHVFLNILSHSFCGTASLMHSSKFCSVTHLCMLRRALQSFGKSAVICSFMKPKITVLWVCIEKL